MAMGPTTARLIQAADRTEARVSRTLGPAFEKMRAKIPLEALEKALARGDARIAGQLIDRMDFADPLQPAGEILKDAVTRGGKIGAEDVG